MKHILITENTKWTTYEGVSRPFKECEDTHLVNIVNHVNMVDNPSKVMISKVCMKILIDRGISLDMLDYAQIPHKDSNGDWAVWSYETSQPKVLQSN